MLRLGVLSRSPGLKTVATPRPFPLSWSIITFTTHSLSRITFRPLPDNLPLLFQLCPRKIVRCASSMFELMLSTAIHIRSRLSKSSKQTKLFVHDSSLISSMQSDVNSVVGSSAPFPIGATVTTTSSGASTSSGLSTCVFPIARPCT